MKHFKLFFACLLMAVLSIGQVWADTASFSQSDLSGQGKSGDGSAFTGATDGDITMGGYGYGANGHVKIYANGTLTFTPSNGATITGITLTANSGYEKTWSASPGSVTVNTTNHTINWTGSSTSAVTLTNTASAQARITAMSVTYTAGGSSNPTGSIEPDPTSVEVTADAVDNGSISIAYTDISDMSNVDDVALYNDAAHTSAFTDSWLTADWHDATKTSIDYVIEANDGAARTAYIYLYAIDDYDNEIEKVIEVTQAKYSAPTGTFNKYTGMTLTEGDYVVTYGTYTLKNEISSNRWANGSSITSGASSLEDPDASVIWHIAPIAETSYWTLYNEAAHKYAAGNNTKNNGALVDMPNEGASDMMKWSATYVATSTWDFENYGRSQLSSNSGNKYLRNNGDNGWAPYASSTTAALTLYKKVVSSEVTISAPEHTTLTVKNSSNVAVASGASIAEGARLYVVATSNDATAYRVAAKAYKTGDESTVVTIDATDSITMPGYPITITADETTLFAVNVAVNDNNMGSATMDGGTATVYKANNETVTLVATPESGHEFVNWTATTGITFDDATKVNGAIATITAAGTITANFQAQGCSNLVAPTLNEVTKTYNSATIAWNTVANADSYSVNVVNHSTSASVFNGSVDALSKELTGLAANTQYDYTVMAIGDGTSYCDENNPTLAGNFTTEDYPAATLTLSDANGTSAFTGSHKLNDVIQLPATAAACSKTFVGWSANSACAVAPEYAPGADYPLSATSQTVYAVYADVTGGGTSTTNIAYNTETTTNMTENTNEAGKFNLDADEWSVVGAKGENSNNVGLNKAKDIRLYWGADGGGNTLTITAPQTITSVGLTFTGDSYNNAWVKVGGETVTLSDGVYPINATTFVIGNNNSENAQVRISNIAVNFTTAGTQSNWSTTCTAAPEATADADDVAALVDVAAAGVANGTIAMTYDHVNESAVSVALYNDAACTEAFEGSWLTASINDDKNIAYTVAENTSYNDARTAYIKLTAPETTAATDPAVVVIPVSQAKKAAVFSSLQELVAADLADPSTVTVTFSDVTIKDFYIYNSKRSGIVFDIQKAGQDIKIYFNNQTTIADWETGGKVSGTLTNCTWKTYSSAWQLAPTGWAWSNLEYTEPAEVSTVVVSGAPTKTTYVDGQKLDPAGLTVTVTYTDASVEVNPVGVTFSEVTLSEGDESADITATFGSVTSAAYNVTGLTVSAIPDKTIAEFIAAGGTRCYLEGIVSNIVNTTYGNFDLTDASGTIYVYGCLTSAGVAAQFSTLGISAGDKIKVIAETYDGTYEEAKNVVFVSKISPVEITIADKTMEVSDVWTIEVETNPAAAAANISYEIKDGSDDCITLAGDVITATAEGEATIIASVEDGDGYLANSVEFTVTVYPAGSTKEVVILVQYDGKYLAMTHEMKALEVEYKYGKLYDVADAKQAEIVWTRTIAAGTATFSYTESEKVYYLKGSGSTTMTVEEGATGAYQWTWNENGYYTTNTTGTIRTFLYQNGQAFKNYAVSNAGNSGYSTVAEFVEEPQFMTTYTRPNVVANQLGTICLPNGGKMEGATPFEIHHMDYDGSGNPYKIYFDEVEEMVAGRPYVFLPEGDNTDVKVYYTDEENAPAGDYKGLYGTYEDIYPLAQGYYIIYNNKYYNVNTDNVRILANRAYIKLSEVPDYDNTQSNPSGTKAPRRISIGNGAPAVATGMENVQGDNVQSTKVMIDGQLFILRGEKMYNANGQLVK